MFLRLPAITRLHTCSRTRRALPRVTVILTLMLIAVQGLAALIPASPGSVRAPSHCRLTIPAIALISNSLRARGARPGVAQDYTLVITPR